MRVEALNIDVIGGTRLKTEQLLTEQLLPLLLSHGTCTSQTDTTGIGHQSSITLSVEKIQSYRRNSTASRKDLFMLPQQEMERRTV